MFFLIPKTQSRPSILSPLKDEKYHIEFARWAIGQANNSLHSSFVEKTKRNKRFYKGDQWWQTDETDTFLTDDTNQERNRLAIAMNQIRPMVEQYRGNAIRMTIKYKANSISPQAINRREVALGKELFYTRIASMPENPFSAEIKKRRPVGETEAETRKIFENVYVDEYIKNMNGLCKFVSSKNSFEDKQLKLAEDLCLSGLGVLTSFEYSGHQIFEEVSSERFFFDRSAIKHDLSDAQFMGEYIEYTPSELFEQFQNIKPEDRKAIEAYAMFFGQEGAVNNSNGEVYTGKIPVFKTFWKDGEFDEYGYVKDQYGYDYFTKINYVYPGEEKPRYTTKDLVKNNSQRAKKILGDKLSTKIYYDVLRCAYIIPREILASVDKINAKDKTDIILEWGISPYQDTEVIDYGSVKFPYKCYCWGYIDGEIFSPVDDAIDPQRFINRIWSVAENQINNAGGVGVAYDKSMVEDQAQTNLDIKHSRPIAFDARGRGIQNAIGNYDGSIKAGTLGLYNLIDAMKNSIKEVTGVNDAIQGQSTGNDQLVGVTQLMIQRGSLMQEPFYNGIVNIYKQCYQSICSVGKRIYADNERNLSIALGDEGAEVIKITKNMNMEDFRAFVVRENSDDIVKQAANQQLLQFKQLLMLDDTRVANLWNRATGDDVAAALRSYALEKQEIQRMAQKKQEEQEANLMAKAEQEQLMNQQKEDQIREQENAKFMIDKEVDLQKEQIKAEAKQKAPIQKV